MPVEFKANNASSTLNGSISSGSTSLVVVDASTFPTTGYFTVIIDSEIIKVTSVSGTTFNITRAQEGTSAASHSSGATITQDLTSASFDSLVAGPVFDSSTSNTKGQEMWIFTTHESNDQNIYLMGSVDGKTFRMLKKDAVINTGSAARDPSIIKYKGKYYIAFTNAGNTYFTIYTSNDLWTWTSLVNVDCSAARSNVFHCWAPQFFYDATDDTLTIFLSISHDSVDTNHQIYYTTPTAADLSTWAVPIAVTGSVWPAASIDPDVVKVGSTYTMYFKDDTNHYIEYATSTSRNSGYTVQTTMDGLGFGINNEAPELQQIDATTWRLYYDNVSGLNTVQYYWRETTSFPTGWGGATAVAATFIPAHSSLIRVQDTPTMRNMCGALMSGLYNRGTQLLRSTNQSISNNTTTAITYTSAGRDDLNAWDGSTKITAPHPGWYIIASHCKWAGATGGKRAQDVRTNGSNYISSVSATTPSDANDPDVNISLPVYMFKGDYAETTVFQNQGSAVNVTASQMYMLEM